MTEKSCVDCKNAKPRDRREDFGDVCELWCAKGRGWCDFRDNQPCDGHEEACESTIYSRGEDR